MKLARVSNRRAWATHVLVPWYKRVKMSCRLLAFAQSEFVLIGMREERTAGALGIQVSQLPLLLARMKNSCATLCTQRLWRGSHGRRCIRGMATKLRWARTRERYLRLSERLLHNFRFKTRIRQFRRPGVVKLKSRSFASCALRLVVYNYIRKRMFGLFKVRIWRAQSGAGRLPEP